MDPSVEQNPIKLKHKKSNQLDQSDEDNPGCLGLLKKISCTLQCGGSTCSIKETENISSSPTESSCESVKPPEKPKARPRKRKVVEKPPPSTIESQESEVTPPKKRVRRTSKKNVPEAP